MVERYMVDTNVASHAIKGTVPTVREKMRRVSMSNVCISVITEAELLYGVAKKPIAVRVASGVREFLSSLEVLAWDSAAAASYGTLRARLERAGTPLGSLDMLIAAHALAIDAVLVTGDRTFRHVDGLTLADWTQA